MLLELFCSVQSLLFYHAYCKFWKNAMIFFLWQWLFELVQWLMNISTGKIVAQSETKIIDHTLSRILSSFHLIWIFWERGLKHQGYIMPDGKLCSTLHVLHITFCNQLDLPPNFNIDYKHPPSQYQIPHAFYCLSPQHVDYIWERYYLGKSSVWSSVAFWDFQNMLEAAHLYNRQ